MRTIANFPGLDVDSAKVALTALARYHALGVALKQKRPEFFEKVVNQAQVLGTNFSLVDVLLLSTLENLMEITDTKKHWPIIESCFDDALKGEAYKATPEEPWAGITHGDFDLSNLMFRKNERGEIDDVKFIDFQFYLYGSPLKDLPYFFFGSLDDCTLTNCFDLLLSVYYDSFISTIKRMNCKAEPFSKELFHKELKKQALIEFPVLAMKLKFLFMEMDEEKTPGVDAENVLEIKCSDLYLKKLVKLISVYEKRGWF